MALEALVCFASLPAKQGDMEYALELLLIVLNHPASFHETKNHAIYLHADLKEQLTKPQVEAVVACGHRVSSAALNLVDNNRRKLVDTYCERC
jgi:hypothetical protein